MKTVKVRVPDDVSIAIAKRGKSAKPNLSDAERNILKHRIRDADDAISMEEDQRILEAAQSDTDNLPAETRRRGRPALPEAEKRKPVTIKLDPRIIRHFKGSSEKGWHGRINDALLEVIDKT